jgi:hypothetical protein
MSLHRGFLIPALRGAKVCGNPAAELVSLPKVELRIGIALFGKAAPFLHRAGKIAGGPKIDASLDVGKRRTRAKEEGGGSG